MLQCGTDRLNILMIAASPYTGLWVIAGNPVTYGRTDPRRLNDRCTVTSGVVVTTLYVLPAE